MSDLLVIQEQAGAESIDDDSLLVWGPVSVEAVSGVNMGKDSLTWTVDNGPPASARWSCSWCGTTIQADGANHDSVVLPTGEVICVTCDADVVGLRRPDDG